MDSVFVEGLAATIASTIVFCGSVFLLLMFVMGARLAYLVTASVTLAFLFIMGLIWSFTNPLTPLGPVGVMPEWEPVSVAEEGQPLEGPAASEYPEGPWEPVAEDDEERAQQSASLGSAGLDAIADGVTEGTFPEVTESNVADTDSIRFLEQDGALYGAVTLEPPPSDTGATEGGAATEETDQPPAPVVVGIFEYDPGDPLGLARLILLGTTVLLVLHLVALSMSEKRARRAREAPAQ